MKENFLAFKLGFNGYGKALSFMFKNRLTYFFLFPLLFNLLLFILGIQAVDYVSENINNYLLDLFFKENTVSNWWSRFLNSFIYWTIWIVSKIIFVFIYAIIGGYLTLILLSPVFTFLSEKTAEIITGKKTKFNLIQFLKDLFRAILIALRNMVLQLCYSVLLFLISMIPVFGWIISLLGSFLISSYFYGFTFMDYANERNKLSIKESVLFVRKNKGFAIGVGGIFSLCFFIPIIGGILASFLAIICVVNATLGVEGIGRKTKLVS